MPSEIFPCTSVNHWLDCKDVAWLHETNCFVVFIVRYARCLMENFTNSMTLVCSNNWETLWFTMLRNNISDFSIHFVWCTVFDCLFQRLIRGFDQFFRGFRNFTYTICFIQISMETINICGNIKVYNITILKGTRVWNTMTNNFIYRSATWTRESIIVQRWWVATCLNNIVVNNFINLLSSHSWLNNCVSSIEGFSCN